MKIGAIDLFCGVGGLSYGFRKNGIDVLGGIDLDHSCRYAFEANIKAPFLSKSVTEVKVAELKRLYSKAKVDRKILIGCAPCQPFSIYTGRYLGNRDQDDRWHLLRSFSRLALELRPDVISMENVPRLQLYPIFDEFVRDLRSANYAVTYGVLRAEHFGVPQRRARLVLFASRYGEISLPKPTHTKPVTVRQTIGKLPRVAAGSAHPSDRLHVSRGLSEINLRRIRASVPGGGWKDWDKSLQLDCHKKAAGKSFRSVYGRMSWDAPSPVITTQCLGIGNGRFGHPVQDRAITIREAALLQSFPRSFKFVAPGEDVIGLILARQIGNAVPVKLGAAIAKTIRKHLETNEG